jgi:hypothetical protein
MTDYDGLLMLDGDMMVVRTWIINSRVYNNLGRITLVLLAVCWCKVASMLTGNSTAGFCKQDSDISWVFDLPTDFATVLDTDKLRAMPK